MPTRVRSVVRAGAVVTARADAVVVAVVVVGLFVCCCCCWFVGCFLLFFCLQRVAESLVWVLIVSWCVARRIPSCTWLTSSPYTT